jgi:methylglutaconyl-CoA hydratase
MNLEIITGLTKIFNDAKKNKEIIAAVLSGDGESFCAGGDLNWMRESIKFKLAQNVKDAQRLSEMYESIFLCPLPVLAYVQGNVMGGGVGLVAVCDIVASDPNTKFCLTEVRLGLIPSIISPYVLRKIPESAARALMLTAEVFKGEEALKMGLVHYLGERETCQEFIAKKLSLISKNGPEATRATKDLIQKIKTSSWAQARKLTVQTIAKKRISPEGQEGMNAFFEKRDPIWRKT